MSHLPSLPSMVRSSRLPMETVELDQEGEKREKDSRILSDKSTNRPRHRPTGNLMIRLIAWGCFSLVLIRSVFKTGVWNRINTRQLMQWLFISLYEEEETQHSCLVYHSTQVKSPWLNLSSPSPYWPPPAFIPTSRLYVLSSREQVRLAVWSHKAE